MEETKTGVGETEVATPRSADVVGSTTIDVMLVLFAGLGSTNVEFVTLAEAWIVVPAAVPVLIWKFR